MPEGVDVMYEENWNMHTIRWHLENAGAELKPVGDEEIAVKLSVGKCFYFTAIDIHHTQLHILTHGLTLQVIASQFQQVNGTALVLLDHPVLSYQSNG
jgi:hypothetical protein